MSDYIDAPTPRQIVEHLEAGGKYEWWDMDGQGWESSFRGVDAWRTLPDQECPNPGYRLVPIKPRTEMVPWYEAKGRTTPDGRRIMSVAWWEGLEQPTYYVAPTGAFRSVPPDDGVEVLVEDAS